MRFKKGTKVEVLTLKEGQSGWWCCAEIIGSNSHRYTVKYEGDFGKATVEKVSWGLVRPCPPHVDVLQDWVPGDVVEVLHNFSWKMATVLRVPGRNHLLVRLLGSAFEFKANKYDVRARICWQDGEWIVIGKASNQREDLRYRFPSSHNENNQPQRLVNFMSGHIKGDDEFTRNTSIVPESKAMPLKRRLSRVHSEIKAYESPNKKKIRLWNKESLWNQSNAKHQFQLPEKVENVAFSREVQHEKYMHSSLIMEKEKTNGGIGYSRSINIESNDSVSSSVASCSVYRNPSYALHHVFARGQYEDNDSQCSDAESICQLKSEEGYSILPAKEVLTEEIRRLELHAYRSTIGALYASGPLSWEQELLLTNLRDSLHISNDEHLAEIRNLVSSSICIPRS